MYFYVLDGGSWEEYYKTVFCSKTKYSEEEFMEIIKKSYLHTSGEISKEYKIHQGCDFCINVGIVLGSDKFNEYLERISDLKVIDGDVKIHVGTSISRNENTNKIESTLISSNFFDCADNCEYENDDWHKKRLCLYTRCKDDWLWQTYGDEISDIWIGSDCCIWQWNHCR